jgi:hypothetical protein
LVKFDNSDKMKLSSAQVILHILESERRAELLANKKPLVEGPRPLAPKNPPTQEKLDFLRDYVARRYDMITLSDLVQEWKECGTAVKLKDPDDWIVAIVRWKDGAPEICEFTTCYLMRMQNKRFPYSCGFSQRDDSLDNGSPEGKLAAARSAVGGIMSTN